MTELVQPKPQFQELPPGRTLALGILQGAFPWILAGVFFGFGWVRLAAGTKVTIALVQNWQHFRSRRLKALEIATLLYGAIEAFVTLGLGQWWLLAYGGVASQSALFVMAIASVLLGSPFTYQYAREAWSREYWKNELFIRTNVIISTAFAFVFAISALASLVALRSLGSSWLAPVLTTVIPIGLGVAVTLFSIAFPRFYTHRQLSRQLAKRFPHTWEIPRRREGDDNDFDVIVIGAGIGGLVAAAVLAKRGLKVAVIEKHDRPGGCCSSWKRTTDAGTFVFDAGVHDVSGLSARGATSSLLNELALTDALRWQRTSHGLYLDGKSIELPSNAPDFIRLLEEQFPEESEGIHQFFCELEQLYRELYADIEATGGVPTHPRTVEAMLAYPKRHPAIQRSGKRSFQEFLFAHVASPELRRILASFSGYLTDDLAKVSVAEMAPIFGYMFDGGHYPLGSSQAIANALVGSLESNGGTLQLRTSVKRIVVENSAVVGIELSRGKLLRAPIVISNADLRRTYLELLGETHLTEPERAHAATLQPSPSVIMTFLGLDIVPRIPALVHASVNGVGFGVAVTSLLDPALAPNGHASVTLTSLVSAEDASTWVRNSDDYRARKTQALDRLIELAEAVIPNLRDHIVYREDASPATVSRYIGATNGAIYGVERGQQVPTAKTSVIGLLLAGSGVTPGSGIEAVIISGMLAALEIQPDVLKLTPRSAPYSVSIGAGE